MPGVCHWLLPLFGSSDPKELILGDPEMSRRRKRSETKKRTAPPFWPRTRAWCCGLSKTVSHMEPAILRRCLEIGQGALRLKRFGISPRSTMMLCLKVDMNHPIPFSCTLGPEVGPNTSQKMRSACFSIQIGVRLGKNGRPLGVPFRYAPGLGSRRRFRGVLGPMIKSIATWKAGVHGDVRRCEATREFRPCKVFDGAVGGVVLQGRKWSYPILKVRFLFCEPDLTALWLDTGKTTTTYHLNLFRETHIQLA